MHAQLNQDLETIDHLLSETLAIGLDYLRQLDTLPTSVASPEKTASRLSEKGSGGLASLEEFQSRFSKLMVASTGPRYWGFVTGGSTPAALMGDMLATIYDQNTQTDKGHGDVSAHIEFETIDLLLDLFDLPKDYLGGFVTGATMSNFTCLGVARQWYGHQLGLDFAKNGVTQPVQVLSATPHSSCVKALSMLGLGSASIQLVKVLEGRREAMDLEDLKIKIEALKGAPFILISSGGTVNTVDFDDLQALSELKKAHHFWWHIDAAFGGFAAVSPAHAHLLKGWEHADSITVDGHKWLNVPYESAFFFIKEKHRLLQVATYQNSSAPYLGDPLENFNFLNFLPENSRRFKALAAWFTLRAYGKEGYREIIERTIDCARKLGAFIEQSDRLELLAPVRLNTVCFSLVGEVTSEQVDTYLHRINDTGRVFMTPTTFGGKRGIRAALVNWRTTTEDVDLVKEVLLKSL